MKILEIINIIIGIVFLLCYSYQFLYIPISVFARQKKHKDDVLHKIGILIAARNEEAVIGNLIDSIKSQNYPSELIDIYVCADNCTDRTAKIAAEHGADVFERFNKEKIGKGYVLNFMLNELEKSGDKHDAYIVLDADNILDPNFIKEINRTYCDGYKIVTCYRNSKNYGDNWVSAGMGLWFLREARYLNAARFAIGSSCAVSGTGFLVSADILKNRGGWNYFTLTEDIEFTIDNITRKEKIGYAKDAILYDEQPTKFRQSWRQRVRWTRGYFQVFRKHGKDLINGIFHGSFSCFDMTMNIMPAAIISGLSVVVNIIAIIVTIITFGPITQLLQIIFSSFCTLYLATFIVGFITVLTEGKNIHTSLIKKIFYTFTFPLFMLTFIPVSIGAFFSKSEWKPIVHDKVITLDEIKKQDSEE